MAERNGQPYLVFAGGGTGGHLYPLISIADEIRRFVPRSRFCFLTTRREIDERVVRHAFASDMPGVEIVPQPVTPWPGSPGGLIRFLRNWRASTGLCRRRFRRATPDLVIGSGGYGSAPPIYVARRLGVPSVLLNPDAVPGRANRFLAPKVRAVYAQWPVTRSHLHDGTRVRVLGCPVRQEFRSPDRSAGIRRFGLDGSKKTLVITGASQGAHSINEALAAAARDLSRFDGWQFLHLTGEADVDSVQNAYARQSLSATVLAYTEQMADALAVADLVVCRAGASTLAEITAVGVASVLMPYPYHRDRHQYANAAVLADAGAAVILEDRVSVTRNVGPLSEVLMPLMGDPQLLKRMARRATGLGKPDAATTIAREVLSLIGYGCDGVEDDVVLADQSEKWRDFGSLDDDENRTDSCSTDGAVHRVLVTRPHSAVP